MKRILFALAALLLFAGAVPAHAQLNNDVGGFSFFDVNSSFTRPANTTQYTANTAVCQSTSVVCTPLSWSIARTNPPGTLSLLHVKLTKSGSATTAATFILWLYSATPTVSTTIKDNIAYTGPFAADWGNWIGSATCSTAITGSDSNVFYDCTLSQNVLIAKAAATSTSIFGLLEVTGTWTPASGETVQVELSGYQD